MTLAPESTLFPSIFNETVYSGEGVIPGWLPLDSPIDSGLTFSARWKLIKKPQSSVISKTYWICSGSCFELILRMYSHFITVLQQEDVTWPEEAAISRNHWNLIRRNRGLYRSIAPSNNVKEERKYQGSWISMTLPPGQATLWVKAPWVFLWRFSMVPPPWPSWMESHLIFC